MPIQGERVQYRILLHVRVPVRVGLIIISRNQSDYVMVEEDGDRRYRFDSSTLCGLCPAAAV